MRTVRPSLNDGWYDESYLRAFNFLKLGENVRIHKTVVLPDPPSVAIGSNVTIGPCVVITADNVDIGDNVSIHPFVLLDGTRVDIPSGSIVKDDGHFVCFPLTKFD